MTQPLSSILIRRHLTLSCLTEIIVNNIKHTVTSRILFIILSLVSVNTYAQKDLLYNLRKQKVDTLLKMKSQTSNLDTLSAIYYALGVRTLDENGLLSIAYFDTSLVHSQSAENEINENYARQFRVTALINATEYLEARRQLAITKPFHFNSENENLQAEWHIRTAFLETELGNHDEALEHLTSSLQISLKTKNFLSLHDAYNRIGLVYSALGEIEKSLEYFNKILESNKANNVRYYRTAAYNNAAPKYRALGDTLKAIEYYEKSVELRSKGKSLRTKAYVYGNKVDIEYLKGNINKAILYNDSALQLFKKIELRPMIISSLQGMTFLHGESNNEKQKIKYLEESLYYVNLWDFTPSKPNIYKAYADHLADTGRWKEAYRLQAMSNTVQDSLRIISAQKDLIKLEARLASQKEKDQIQKLQLEKELRIGEIKWQSQLSKLLLFSIVLLGGLIALLFLRSKERQKVNSRLSEKNEQIATNLQDKEILLKEIHHRVKNNLQIVSSMLNLHSRHIKDKAVKDALTESRNRVKSMAMIHQKLYQEDNLKGVALPDYIESLISSLMHSYRITNNIVMLTDIDDLILDVDSTIPLGLILNELLTNAIKYAFDEEENGEIWIRLKEKENRLILQVNDNGKGIQENQINESGFGFTLIKSLCEKLRADFKLEDKGGTHITLNIKNYKKIQ